MKEQVKETIQILANQLNAQIQSSAGSLFTRDDVHAMFNVFKNQVIVKVFELEEQPTPSAIDENELYDFIVDAVESLRSGDVADVDYSSAEFDITNGNEIELTDVSFDVNTDNIADAVYNKVLQFINK